MRPARYLGQLKPLAPRLADVPRASALGLM
jgi:hypothetical protein